MRWDEIIKTVKLHRKGPGEKFGMLVEQLKQSRALKGAANEIERKTKKIWYFGSQVKETGSKS